MVVEGEWLSWGTARKRAEFHTAPLRPGHRREWTPEGSKDVLYPISNKLLRGPLLENPGKNLTLTHVWPNPAGLSDFQNIACGVRECVAKIPWRFVTAVAAGAVALGYYLSWWFAAGRLASPGLALLLAVALAFVTAQLLGHWLLYLVARTRTTAPRQQHSLSVDVFVTACGEPPAMVERALRAAVALEGEHCTYLLDDGHNPASAQLCERFGAHYRTRGDNAGAKAGNLNAALPCTGGDIVVTFDIDHVPQPDFLSHTVHHFADPTVGFVQVMLTFSNQDESWVARAAAETSLDFYNPTSFGMDALRSATLMGSNALIRRTALKGIGGYQLGLAEDLATSLALHAAGWRSVYVAQPLAPGLAPANLAAWYTQQLKWARGVFEILLTAFPRAIARLDWGERLAYTVRMTKYWIGPAVFLHLAMSAGALLFASAPTRAAVQDYMVHLVPLMIGDLLIRREAIRLWRHASVPAVVPLRAIALVYATWPIYTLAWIMALVRIPLGFRPTPKAPSGSLNPVWLLPQTIACVALLVGAVITLTSTSGMSAHLLLGFAAFQMGLQLWPIGLWASWQTSQGRQQANEASRRGQAADV